LLSCKGIVGDRCPFESCDIFEEYIKAAGVETGISQFECTEKSLKELTNGVFEVSFSANGTLASIPPITRDEAYAIYKLAL